MPAGPLQKHKPPRLRQWLPPYRKYVLPSGRYGIIQNEIKEATCRTKDKRHVPKGRKLLFRFSFLNVGNSKNVKTRRNIQWIARRLTALIAPMVVKYSWNAVHTHSSTLPPCLTVPYMSSYGSPLPSPQVFSVLLHQVLFLLPTLLPALRRLMFIHSDSSCTAILRIKLSSLRHISHSI